MERSDDGLLVEGVEHHDQPEQIRPPWRPLPLPPRYLEFQLAMATTQDVCTVTVTVSHLPGRAIVRFAMEVDLRVRIKRIDRVLSASVRRR